MDLFKKKLENCNYEIIDVDKSEIFGSKAHSNKVSKNS
jgi:hypothetical protein